MEKTSVENFPATLTRTHAQRQCNKKFAPLRQPNKKYCPVGSVHCGSLDTGKRHQLARLRQSGQPLFPPSFYAGQVRA